MTILPVENMSMARETNIVYQQDFSHMEVLQEILDLYRSVNRRFGSLAQIR